MSRNVTDGFWYKRFNKSFLGQGIVTGHKDVQIRGVGGASVVSDFEQDSGVILFPQLIGTVATLKKEGHSVAYHGDYTFMFDNPSSETLDVVMRRYATPTNGATLTTIVGTFSIANGTQVTQTFSKLSGDVYLQITNTATPSSASTITYAIVLF